ncbi:MAG: hypothetical protein FJ272_05500 [Planctomycetes bacterium]|nr:hypothetical protein [Planctomycetota bacterium]
MNRWLFVAALLVALAAGDAVAQDVVYVKSRTAKIRADKSASADAKEVPAGTALKVLSKEDKYYQVQLPDGSQGWVFHVSVTDQKPDEGGGVLAGTGATSGITVAEASTSASIRGLKPMAEDYAKNKGISPKSVDGARKMEELAISSKDVDVFLREGKLGEYAEVKK